MQLLLPKFAAFLLSFIIVAILWNIHYELYQGVKKIDRRIVWATFVWMFFIVTIPFSASLVSTYFMQKVSTFVYSLNILLLACCLNYIWDYIEKKKDYIAEEADKRLILGFRVSCHVGVINGIIAVIFSLVIPERSFIILLLRPVTTQLVKPYYHRRFGYNFKNGEKD